MIYLTFLQFPMVSVFWSEKYEIYVLRAFMSAHILMQLYTYFRFLCRCALQSYCSPCHCCDHCICTAGQRGFAHNCLLRGATCCGSCVRTADSDTLPLCSGEGVNAEPMTDLMFSVSHPAEGAKGVFV